MALLQQTSETHLERVPYSGKWTWNDVQDGNAIRQEGEMIVFDPIAWDAQSEEALLLGEGILLLVITS